MYVHTCMGAYGASTIHTPPPQHTNQTHTPNRPERVIAVFGHGDFFHTFLRLHMGIRGKWMDNCEAVVGRLLLHPGRGGGGGAA